MFFILLALHVVFIKYFTDMVEATNMAAATLSHTAGEEVSAKQCSKMDT